jgi:hypothetical protein
MPPLPRTPTRLALPRFAAHLAHLLNAGEGAVATIEPALVELTLSKTLATAGGQAAPYREVLLGFSLVADGASAEELADRYLRDVLGRRLFLARNNETHKGHELFGAICRRGFAEGWTDARLARTRSQPDRSLAPRADDGVGIPLDFRKVAERLANLDSTISPGNPAATTRAAKGPLVLEAGRNCAEVIEELAVRDAVISGPHRLRRLRAKADFDAFCSLVIKAVEAAHDHYGKILAIGLPPFGWMDVLSVNTAKAIGAFLLEARRQDNEGRGHTIAAWRRAWEKRKVPGYASADAFWDSEIGRALRQPQLRHAIDVDASTVANETDPAPEPELQPPDVFIGLLERCLNEGIISANEGWLIREIHDGVMLAELRGRPDLRMKLGVAPDRLAEHVAALTERVLDWAQSRHPDKRE